MIVKFLADVSAVELSLFRFVLFAQLDKFLLKNEHFSRFLGVLLPSVSYVIYRNENVFPEGKRKILLLRCFVGKPCSAKTENEMSSLSRKRFISMR